MSTTLLEPNQKAVSSPSKQLTEAYYTICGVFVASNVAVELGWLDEEFKRVGAKAIYLRSLAHNAGWLPHFTHSLPNLFRDGGSIPTIEAKADRTDTRLIGLTWGQTGGQILVRSNSGIHRVADLKGRKFGLVTSQNKNKVDFSRATAHRGILLALDLAGLGEKDASIIDLNHEDDPKYAPAQRPSEFSAQGRAHRSNPLFAKDLAALQEGRVDAIYTSAARSYTLVQSGDYTVIEDFSNHPDWTLQVANAPHTNAVNAEFAKEHPEVAVAFLRASVRAGRWINRNRGAAAEIFKRITSYDNVELIKRQIADIDFVPQLSPKNIAATEIQKKFLRDHGYIKNDFDVKAWVDSSFLEEAIRSLPAED